MTDLMTHDQGSILVERGAGRPRHGRRGSWAGPLGLAAVMAILLFGGGAVTPGFLTTDNLQSVLLGAAITGMVAVSMTPITMSGNFVSLASSQTAMVAAIGWGSLVAHGWPYALAGAVVLIALGVLGAVEGVVVSLGLNTLITTLAVGAIIYGAAAQRTEGNSVNFAEGLPHWLTDGEMFGLPTAIYALFAVTIVVAFLMHLTVLGRWITLTGANVATARISGIPVRAITVTVFVVATLGAAMAGMMASAQVGAANVEFLPTLTVDSIAAILIGGTAIAGGHGSPLRSAVGALIIAIVNNLLSRHGLDVGPAQAVLGLTVLVVIIGLRLMDTRRSR